jgi:hypothetical protein
MEVFYDKTKAVISGYAHIVPTTGKMIRQLMRKSQIILSGVCCFIKGNGINLLQSLLILLQIFCSSTFVDRRFHINNLVFLPVTISLQLIIQIKQ